MNRESTRMETLQSEVDTLKQRMAALEAAHARCDMRIRELHDQNTNLVQLTVASQLLATSIEREEVLSAIEEVVINMIGSEELAIFDLDRDGVSLRIARIHGMDPTSPRLKQASDPIRGVVSSGSLLVVKERDVRTIDRMGGLTAAIPLVVERNVMGVVAIFRLVRQKLQLDPNDHDLFEVLSRQAAMALHSTTYRSLRPTVRPPRRSK